MTYSPALGRFLELDPIGEFPVTGEDYSTKEAIEAAKHMLANVFDERTAQFAWLWKFASGGNLYQFVSGNSLKFTDPSGMEKRGWPNNGVVQIASGFRPASPVFIWNDDGWRTIAPGECTPEFSEDWDYIYIDGQYFKVGPAFAHVCHGPKGAGVRVIAGGTEIRPVPIGEWTPPAPPIRPTTKPSTQPLR